MTPKKPLSLLAGTAILFLLAACGGADQDAPGAAHPQLLASATAVNPNARYEEAVQQLYVAYFGRPADPGGLANFTRMLAEAGAPTDIQALNRAYDSNPQVRALIDAFGTSAESQALYAGGTTADFITSVYLHLPGRAPDDGGKAFWVGAVNGGGLTRGHAALSIMAGALADTSPQGRIDAATVTNKVRIASAYTASLNTAELKAAYNGDDDAARLRGLLAKVGSATDPAAYVLPVYPAHAIAGGKTEGAIKAVALPRQRRDYTLRRNLDGSYRLAGTDGSAVSAAADTTVLRFADGSVNLALPALLQGAPAADVQAVIETFIACFNRVPEADAVEYWLRQRLSGQGMDQVAESMFKAALQFASTSGYTPGITSGQFVRTLYANLTGDALGEPSILTKTAVDLDALKQTHGMAALALIDYVHAQNAPGSNKALAAMLANKYAVGYYFAVEQSLSFADAATALATGKAALAAVTAADAGAGKAALSAAVAGFSLPVEYAMAIQPDYAAPVRVEMAVPPVTPVANAKSAGRAYFFHYDLPRTVQLADLNRDGLDDIVTAPTLFTQGPKLPVEIWLNKGGGRFENATASIIEGAVPVTGSTNNIFVADFNRDGVADIVIVDQGAEDKDCSTAPGCDGATLIVLMSQPNGRLKDVSATALPGNVAAFNHVSAMGDLNGDGLPDLAIARLGGFSMEGDGVVVYLNRGDGTFSRETTSLLPDEIAYIPSKEFYSPAFDAAHPAPYSRQRAGSTAIADLDGDGVNELLTCSYTGVDSRTNERTLRIHKRGAGGRFVEAARLSIPDAIKGDASLGCAGISVGDASGDGLPELLVNWESNFGAGVKMVLLKNLGGLKFSDVTLAAIGTYKADFESGGYNFNPLTYVLRDINGDGLADITYGASGVRAGMLATGMPTALINTGKLSFVRQRLRVDGAAVDEAGAAALLGCEFCGYLPLYGKLRPRTGERGLDMLLWSSSEKTTPAPVMESAVVLRTLLAK
jgi:hypothetical protein